MTNGAPCCATTASPPATTATSGRTRSLPSRSVTTSGSSRSRRRSCTASSTSCATCVPPRLAGTCARRSRSSPARGSRSPTGSNGSREPDAHVVGCERVPHRGLVIAICNWNARGMTSTSTVPDLEPAGAALAAAVAATDPGRLDAPTPCADWSVRDLLAHIDDLVPAFTAAAAKDLGPSPDTDPAPRRSVLRPGWAERLPREIGTLVGAWRDPDAWTGMTRAGGVDLPGDVAGVVALDELVLHGWDLARATGQDYRIDE